MDTWTSRVLRDDSAVFSERADVVSLINMGHRGRLADIGVVVVQLGVNARPLRPHRGHGHVGVPLHLHPVADCGTARLVRLSIHTHAASVERLRNLATVVLRQEIGDRLAEVPQKPIAALGTVDDPPGKYGHPPVGRTVFTGSYRCLIIHNDVQDADHGLHPRPIYLASMPQHPK